jgi:hypothetical protein
MVLVVSLNIEDLKRSSRIRCHHLLKTFWTASDGWCDRQLPDGIVI